MLHSCCGLDVHEMLFKVDRMGKKGVGQEEVGWLLAERTPVKGFIDTGGVDGVHAPLEVQETPFQT